jgi:hypothetical protein
MGKGFGTARTRHYAPQQRQLVLYQSQCWYTGLDWTGLGATCQWRVVAVVVVVVVVVVAKSVVEKARYNEHPTRSTLSNKQQHYHTSTIDREVLSLPCL